MVARKIYKRTINKVEWLILDFGGHEIYKSLHSTFFSSIDHDNEPTIFVLVYNHTEYSTENHYKSLGCWIESILFNSKTTDKSKLNIKLVGIENHKIKSPNEPEKLKEILQNCKLTIKNYFEKLSSQKEKLDKLLNPSDGSKLTNQNKLYINEAKLRLENLIKRKVNLVEDICLVNTSYRRELVDNVVKSIENLTIQLNKTVPLDLKNTLKDHLVNLRTSSINQSDLASSLETNQNLQKIIKTNKRFDLNAEKIIHYAKTIGDIFWLKNNKKLSKKIYIRFDYILTCLKFFIKHNLKDELTKSKRSIFNTCGIFETDQEYEESLELFRNYGILEHNMVKFICFGAKQMSQEEIETAFDLLVEYSIIYKSSTQYLEEKCSYFNLIVPAMCSANFENEKQIKLKQGKNEWDVHLYLDRYEIFFIRQDQIRSYREEVKEMSAMKKQREIWNSQETDLFPNECLGEVEDTRMFNLMDTMTIGPLKFDIMDENGGYNFKDEEQEAKKYKFKCEFELASPFEIDVQIFNQLSALIQDFTYERFDWVDTIVGRDSYDNCFRIKLLNEAKNSSFKITIEIKSVQMDLMSKLKDQFESIIESLFNSSPGLFFTKTFIIFN